MCALGAVLELQAVDHGGEICAVFNLDCVAVEQVPFGHKIALKPISAGQAVIKYSKNIGLAAVDIEQGSCVHTHNIESQRGRGDRDGGKK